jgi:hypothetical protein
MRASAHRHPPEYLAPLRVSACLEHRVGWCRESSGTSALQWVGYSLELADLFLYFVQFYITFPSFILLYSRPLFPPTLSTSSTPRPIHTPLDSLTSTSQLDRCSPCWCIHCAEDTRQERGVFPVSPRIAAPHRVVHTRIDAHNWARTTSGGERTPRVTPRLPRPLRLRRAGTRARLSGPLASVRRTTAMAILILTTSAWNKAVRKGSERSKGTSGGKVTPPLHDPSVSSSLTSLLQLDRYSLRRVRPPCCGDPRRECSVSPRRATRRLVPRGWAPCDERGERRARAQSLRIPVTGPPAAATRCGSSSAMGRYAFALFRAHSAPYDDSARARLPTTGL